MAPTDVTSPEAGYRLLFDAHPGAMWIHDAETLRILEVNSAAVAQYGYDRDALLGLTALDLAAPEDVPALLECLVHQPADRAGNGIAAARRVRHRRADATSLPVEMSAAPTRFGDRQAVVVLAWAVAGADTAPGTAGGFDGRLREAQELAGIGSFEWDIGTDQVRWSDEIYRIFGVAPHAFPATYDAFLDLVHPEDRPAVATSIGSTLDPAAPDWFDLEHRIVQPDGSVRWLSCRGRLTRDGGRAVGLIGVCQDITARREVEEGLSRLALHDPLTGLPNRSLLMDRLSQGLLRLPRGGGGLAVLFVDLDRFKAINDRLGHAAGDEVLVVVGGRLREVLRPHDTLARLGGDEFAILCEDLTHEQAAVAVARRVLDMLGQPIAIEGGEITISASVGIAATSRADVMPDSLLREADMAMYRAKERGRNRVEVFDHSARTRTQARMQIAEELRRAVDEEQLRVVYQPTVNLVEMGTTGVEALVRWEHPTRGLLSPAEFIETAESTGVVVPLGAWVIRQACQDLLRLDRLNRRSTPLSMSVNLSARQLGSPDFVGFVRDTLAEIGVDPARICFEITESVLMDDVESAIDALGGLRKLGVRLAIDDFGTGYSSLGYLRRFPVDVVKLDRSFVAGLGSDSAADAIVAAVINLVHALGMEVVAEGVETDEQLTVLRAFRCDHGQGFLWSRPLAVETVASWLQGSPSGALDPAAVDVGRALAERIALFRGEADRPIILRAPSGLADAYADAGAIRSIIDHLLTNAVKYSPPDRPVVVSAASDRQWVRFSVADYGIGMTSDEANRCFEPFWQADGAGSSDDRGTGVGLYIVRSLVETMGGHVAVISARSAGSTFTVALPRSARRVQRRGGTGPGIGEDSSIREFMRQIGVPNRRGR